MAGWIKMKLGMHVGLGPGHIVLDGDQLPLPQKDTALPIFGPYLLMAGCIKMPLGRDVGLSPSDIVLDGDPAPFQKREHGPQFSAHVYCGQTAEWIKMTLGMR